MSSTSFRRDRRCRRSQRARGRSSPTWLLAGLLAAGCRGPALGEPAVSLPDARGAPARLVVTVDDQPVLVRFDPASIDHLQWAEWDPDEPPPNPLVELPHGAAPDAAWVLRTRRRGSSALVPTVYLGVREGRFVYVTREDGARCGPGTSFEVLDDLAVRVSDPTAPPPASGPPPDDLLPLPPVSRE